MSGYPCAICYRWVLVPYGVHNAAHLRANPHTFCRTIRCGRGCPVKRAKA